MKPASLLIIFTIVTILATAQDSPVVKVYDSIPVIQYFAEDLDLLSKVRCATYLFARDFRVFDSLGNLYINLFFTDDFIELETGKINYSMACIHDYAYLFALHEDID